MNIKKQNGNIKIKLAIIILTIIIVSVLIIVVFNKNHDDVQKGNINVSEKYEYFPLYTIDEEYGVVDREGKIVVEPKYTQIYIPNQSEDVFICFEKENYKIINKKEEDIFTEYEEVFPIFISENSLEMEKTVLSYKKDGLYGLIDIKGKKITDAIYEKVESLKSKPGNIAVKKDGLYGVLDLEGNIIIPAKYNSVKGDEYCSEKNGYLETGYIISEKTKTGIIFGYADYTGKVIIKPKYESISRALEYEDSDIYLIVMENGKKGVIKNKKQIINHKYQSINYYGTSNVFIVNRNGKYGFFNEDGKEILETKYTDYSIAGEYIFVQKDENSQLFDIHGNLVNSNNYKSIVETGNPAYFIAENEEGYYSIISKDMQINEKYTNITYAFDNFFIFTNEDGKSGVLNVYTGIEIEPEYDYILLAGNVKALEAKKDNVVEIYSENIEKILTMQDGIVENIGTDYLAVHSKNELQYVNKSGELVKNTEVYSDLKLYSIEQDGKWGFADKMGNVVVDCKYDIVTELNEYGFAGIYQEGKWGVVDENGKVVVVPSYEIETYYSPKFIGKYKLEELDNVHCIEIKE